MNNNNPEFAKMAEKMDELNHLRHPMKLQQLYHDIIAKFDKNIILNQCITTSTPSSIYYHTGNFIHTGKHHIANKKYRAHAAHKQFKKSLQTFIIGKMSFECYCFYKLFANKTTQTRQKLNDKTNSDRIEYDITLLIRKRTADEIISPVIKNTSMYWIKNAWEHLDDLSQSSSIIAAFLHEVSRISKAFDYYEKLAKEMINLRPKLASIRCDLAIKYYNYEWSLYERGLTVFEKADNDIPNNALILAKVMHYYAESLKLGGRCRNGDITMEQRAQKAIKYAQQLMDLEKLEHYVYVNRYGIFANLLCNWSEDLEKDKTQQTLALSMFEKAIELDQKLGWYVINNWTRDYIKFETRLKDIVIQYWYVANENDHISSDVLDCADLIETYFNDNPEKMKRAKILSNSVPIESNVLVHEKQIENDHSGKTHTRKKFCVSIRKPAKFEKQRILDYKGTKIEDYGIILASWDMDDDIVRGRGLRTSPNWTKFCKQYAAKLAYFFALMYDSDELLNEIGITKDIKKHFRLMIIRLLVYYVFKLRKKYYKHPNIVRMIESSNWLMTMVNGFINGMHNMSVEPKSRDDTWTMSRIGEICDKIEKMIDL